jgi:hypothetical protein
MRLEKFLYWDEFFAHLYIGKAQLGISKTPTQSAWPYVTHLETRTC